MNTFHLALVVFTAGLLCACDAVGQDEKKAESHADLPFEETLSKAKAGDVAAMFNLGVAYDNGKGVIENDVEAYAWFHVAAVNGQKKAAKLRDNIKKNMAPKQIAEGLKRSRKS